MQGCLQDVEEEVCVHCRVPHRALSLICISSPVQYMRARVFRSSRGSLSLQAQAGWQKKQSQGRSQQTLVQGRGWEVATDSMARAPAWHLDAAFRASFTTAKRQAKRQTGMQEKGSAVCT